MPNLLLAVTGSVAAIKTPSLIQQFREHGQVDIRIIATQHSQHFFSRDEVAALGVQILTDEDEWKSWKSLADSVLHIELRKWADVLLIAPLDANTMAKMAAGMCDNLLTCVVRAWDRTKPQFYCPAMNTVMWDHPVTREHQSKLSEFGFREIAPVVKRLACGDYGTGAMAEVPDIVRTVVPFLSHS